jgi:antitoxin StbD
MMRQILADCSASISELKKNPSALLKEAGGAPIAILNHNTPAAYLISADTWERLMERLEDIELAELLEARRDEYNQAVEVTLDEL